MAVSEVTVSESRNGQFAEENKIDAHMIAWNAVITSRRSGEILFRP